MSEMKCPVCGDLFEMKRAAKSGGTPTCTKPACRKRKQRMGTEWENFLALLRHQTDSSTAFPTPAVEGLIKADIKRIQEEVIPKMPTLIDSLKDWDKPFPEGMGGPERPKKAPDINALARQVILSKVPVKRVEDDSIEARLKRLESAVKQFQKKKQPAGKGGPDA